MKMYNFTSYKYIGKYIKNILEQYELPKKFRVCINITEAGISYLAWNGRLYEMNIELPEILFLYIEKPKCMRKEINTLNLSFKKFIKFCILHELAHLKLKHLYRTTALDTKKDTRRKQKEADIWALKELNK